MFKQLALALGMMGMIATGGASAVTIAKSPTGPESARHVDVVIALDVSGSMSGLIDSAKQRLWDIVNELGQAEPRPRLRVAVVSYGNPSYGRETGYVRISRPFTTDLDAVNKTLFSFETNGGDEYVARVLDRSINALDWSQQPDALRIAFVAGNESAAQDPQISLAMATAGAAQRDIVVNTIYCGGADDPDAAGWRRIANLSQGMYASIDQQAAAVANIATPMDDRLLELNEELNRTYISYGREGEAYRANQVAQDANAAVMSTPAAASRAVTKGGRLYSNVHWDLVDAVESGKKLDEVETDTLPKEMQGMSHAERERYVSAHARKRREIKAEIAALGRSRDDYIARKRNQTADDDSQGLDEVIQSGLRSVAERKGFSFN
ncbi:MAG: vWA domain-containing protein [Gammaproteobacteria bacterium]